jgi:hypothetical protein
MARNTTVDEWVTTLKDSDLPTVIVEGENDIPIYRRIEKYIGVQDADIIQVGGRNNLLSLYKRRNEFANLRVAFIADKDLWLFSGIPPDYPEIIWTEGYSIENDLYAGADLEKVLNANDVNEHRLVLNSIIEWFAFEVEEYLAGREAQVATGCNTVVPLGQTEMDQGFCTCRGFRSPDEKLHQQITEGYQLQLRGKLLFEILIRFLNASNTGEQYSVAKLHQIAFDMKPPDELMDQLIHEIERAITEHASPN